MECGLLLVTMGGFRILGDLRILRTSSITKHLPDADPYLFPAAAFLSGWGILTIWRLDPANLRVHARRFGLVSVSSSLIWEYVYRPHWMFRKYKYILSGGLLLTALTLLFGTNPGGIGPRLWLGCCDVYFQPSEPLKLLLIAYLAAYFADKLPTPRSVPSTLPTFLSGIVILLFLFNGILARHPSSSLFTRLSSILPRDDAYHLSAGIVYPCQRCWL